MTWALILAIIGSDGEVRQIEAVPTSFATSAACNDAGALAAASLPAIRHPREARWHRVDWICVPTGGAESARAERRACELQKAAREAARVKLREELREVFDSNRRSAP